MLVFQEPSAGSIWCMRHIHVRHTVITVFIQNLDFLSGQEAPSTETPILHCVESTEI
jgi:hypothetical protein